MGLRETFRIIGDDITTTASVRARQPIISGVDRLRDFKAIDGSPTAMQNLASHPRQPKRIAMKATAKRARELSPIAVARSIPRDQRHLHRMPGKEPSADSAAVFEFTPEFFDYCQVLFTYPGEIEPCSRVQRARSGVDPIAIDRFYEFDPARFGLPGTKQPLSVRSEAPSLIERANALEHGVPEQHRIYRYRAARN
jgi:hypothetical protein